MHEVKGKGILDLLIKGSTEPYLLLLVLFWSGSKNSRPSLTTGQNLTKITRLICIGKEKRSNIRR